MVFDTNCSLPSYFAILLFSNHGQKVAHLHEVSEESTVDLYEKIDGIKNMIWLIFVSSNKVIQKPDEQIYLWSILRVVFSAVAALTTPDDLGY